jgi:hypothetical protein
MSHWCRIQLLVIALPNQGAEPLLESDIDEDGATFITCPKIILSTFNLTAKHIKLTSR